MKTLKNTLISQIDEKMEDEKILGALISIELGRNHYGIDIRIRTSANSEERSINGYGSELAKHQDIELRAPKQYTLIEVLDTFELIFPSAIFDANDKIDGFSSEVERLEFEEDFSKAVKKWLK